MLFENVDKSKEPRITVTQQGVTNKPAIWFHQVDNGNTAVLCLSETVNENLRIYIPNGAQQYTTDADGVKSVTLVTEESFNHWWQQVKTWLDSNLETTIVNWIEDHWDTQFQQHVDKSIEDYNIKLMNDNNNSLSNNGNITYVNDPQQPRGVIPKIHDMINSVKSSLNSEISNRKSADQSIRNEILQQLPVGSLLHLYKSHSVNSDIRNWYLKCDGSVIPSGSQYNDIRSIVGQSRKITLNNCSDVSQMYNLPNGIPSFWIPNISFMEWVRMSPRGNNINLDGSETLTFYEFYWDNGNYDYTGRDPGPYFPTGASYSSSVATSRVSAAGHAWCDAINVDLSTAGNFYYGRRGHTGLAHSGYRVDERLIVGAMDYSSGNDKEWVVWAPDRNYYSGTTNTTRWGIPFYSRNYDSMYLIAHINGGPSSGTEVLVGVLLSDSGWSVSNTYGYTVPSVSALNYYLPDLTRDGVFLGGGSVPGKFKEWTVPEIKGRMSAPYKSHYVCDGVFNADGSAYFNSTDGGGDPTYVGNFNLNNIQEYRTHNNKDGHMYVSHHTVETWMKFK